MNLGLLDILTTQQIDRPDFTKKSDSSSVVLSGNKFKDSLDAPVKKVVSDDKTYRSSGISIFSNKTKSNDISSDTKLLSANVDNSGDVENISVDGEKTAASNSDNQPNDLISLIVNKVVEQVSGNKTPAPETNAQANLSNVYNGIKQLKDNAGSGGNALAALLMLQGVDNKQDSDAGSELDALTAGLEDGTATDSVAQEAGNVVQQLSGVVDQASVKEVNAASNEKANNQFIAEILPDGLKLSEDLLSKIKQDDNGGTKVVATAVLQVAQENASAPDVSQSDVKSDQIISLLKDDSDNQGSEKKIDLQNLSKTETAPKTETAHNTNQVRDSLVGNLQQNKDLSLKLDQQSRDGVQQKVEQLANVVGQAVGQAKHSDGNNSTGGDSGGYKEKLNSLLSNTSDNAPAPLLQGDFVKFQKYVDGASFPSANSSTAANAEDVISQIKFGMSGLAGKDGKNISIQLHPKELGKVDIRMEMSSDGKTKISVMAENTDTLNLLQKEATVLRDMLQDALKTDQSNLSFSFHDRGNEQWKQFMDQSSFANSYGSQEEDLSQISNNVGAYQYQSGMIAVDGLDIRV